MRSQRLMQCLSLLGFLAAFLAGCQSTDSEQVSEMPEQMASVPLKPLGIDCGKRPVTRVCCEALTPACNECRDREQGELSAWRQLCLKPAAAPKSCAGAPPVIDCCSEATPECQDCRESALNQLMVWKQTCGDVDTLACDSRPALSVCCEALIPSCAACRDRNHRIADQWQTHCASGQTVAHGADTPLR